MAAGATGTPATSLRPRNSVPIVVIGQDLSAGVVAGVQPLAVGR
jgi:hypothetical protein